MLELLRKFIKPAITFKDIIGDELKVIDYIQVRDGMR